MKKEDERKLPVRALRRGRLIPSEFFSDFDRLFDDFRTGLEDFFWSTPWRHTGKAITRAAREPPVDIIDTGKEIVVNAEVPGIPKENIEINVTENSIEICAETKEEKEEKEEGYYYRERGYRNIYRHLPLPSEVISEKADASLKHGVLEVRIPKKVPTPEPKKHKVNIR